MKDARCVKTAAERAEIAIELALCGDFGRAFSDCFEMGDGDQVIREVVRLTYDQPEDRAAVTPRGIAADVYARFETEIRAAEPEQRVQCSECCTILDRSAAVGRGDRWICAGCAEKEAPAAVSVKVFDYGGDDWAEFLAARDSGRRVEITEEMFDYWLEVLPPAYMGREITLPGGERRRVAFGFAEGTERITAFWQERTDEGRRRYFCQRTEETATANTVLYPGSPSDSDLEILLGQGAAENTEHEGYDPEFERYAKERF